MAPRRPMSREQAFDWYPKWSQADRRRITDEFDRLGVVRCYEPPSRGYVGCLDATQRVVMYLAPGYVAFKKDIAPERLEHDPWFALTTFRNRSPSIDFEVDDILFCPIHHYQVPATGRCDLCEE